jgi:hypothetical protein
LSQLSIINFGDKNLGFTRLGITNNTIDRVNTYTSNLGDCAIIRGTQSKVIPDEERFS